jgi:PleD family two-component response regulator
MNIYASGGAATKVTVSVGVNTREPTLYDAIYEFISEADTALHEAKASGKNTVRAFEGK